MLLLAHVPRGVDPALLLTPSSPVKDSGSAVHLVAFFVFISGGVPSLLLVLLEALLAHLLVALHHLLLLLRELCLLRLELLLPRVDRPGALKLTRGRISGRLPLSFELLPVGLTALRPYILHVGLQVRLLHVTAEDHELVREGGACVVAWIQSVAKVLKIVILLIEFGGVHTDLLHDACQVVLLGDKLIRCFKFSQLAMLLGKRKVRHVH